jgi:mannose-6-phosphate isomerase-like protein (cupin superfamily)
MGVRTVITGHRADGISTFVSDEVVEPVYAPLLGGVAVSELWGEDDIPSLPTSGERKKLNGFFPAARGYRIGIAVYPPQSHVPEEITDFDAALAETERLLPGVTAAVTDKEGMHATDTVDLQYILEGEIHVTMDSGEETVLKPGDLLVMNGTNHAWANQHPDQPCRVLMVFIGGERRA